MIGLLLFKNEVKPHSAEVVDTLHRSGVKTVICTGDNATNAIAVGRAVGIVAGRVFRPVLDDDVSVSGKTASDEVLWEEVETKEKLHTSDVAKSDVCLAIEQK